MQTIAWDVDDVLNDLMRAWFDQAWRPAHPECSLHYDELKENPPHRLLGVPLERYLASLDAFRLSRAGQDLPPLVEVLAWFRQHGGHFRHLALTATPLASAPLSAAWVLRHFGDWIRSFHFVPSPREGPSGPVYDRTKADFLRWFGRVDVLVDDNPVHIQADRQLGIRALLMPRPWNASRQTASEVLGALVYSQDDNLL